MIPPSTHGTDDVQSPQNVRETWFRDTATGRLDLPQSHHWFNGGHELG